MKAPPQPGQQAGFGGRQIDTGDANLRKSGFARPILQRSQLQETRRANFVNGNVALAHTSIVETPPHLSLDQHWHSETDTRAFAHRLAAQTALRGAYVQLHGELGSGKTTLVRHLLQALGVTGRVKSPTYTVVEPYELPDLKVWHFDFYRFSDPREWEDAGFRDIFASPGLKLAEWPERASGHAPEADLDIFIAVQADGSRAVRLVAHSSAGDTLVHAMAQREVP